MDASDFVPWLMFAVACVLGPLLGVYWTTRSDAVQNVLVAFDSEQGRSKIQNELAHALNPPSYIAMLQGALATVQRRFGERRSRLKLFAALITIAFVYGIFLFTTSWVLGGSGKLGQAELLPANSLRLAERLVLFLAIFGTSWYFFMRSYGALVAHLVRWKRRLNRFLAVGADILMICFASAVSFGAASLLLAPTEARVLGIFAFLLSLSTGIRALVPFMLASLVSILVIVALLIFFVLTIPSVTSIREHLYLAWEAASGAGTLLFLSLAFVGMIITAGRRCRLFQSHLLLTGPIAVLIGATALGRIAFTTTMPTNEALSVAPFWFALPIVNATTDFASILISLWIFERVAALNSHRWTIVFIIADCIIALFLCVFSKVLVVLSLEAIGSLIGVSSQKIFDTRDLLQTAAGAPFSPEAVWFTVMVLTPLLPSFANLVLLVLFAVDRVISPNNFLRIAGLNYPPLSITGPSESNQRFWVAFYLANRQYLRAALTGLVSAFALGILAMAISNLLPELSKSLRGLVSLL